MQLVQWADLAAPLVCAGCRRPGARLCPECRRGIPKAPEVLVPGVDRVLAAWGYEGAARALVLALKMRRDRSAAGPLVEAMHAAVLQHGLGAEIVTWVPARRKDIRSRGFDHAEVLARGLATDLGLPARRLLHKTRGGVDQTTLGAAQRWINQAAAFSACACPARIAIVDDLVTTGATASSCGLALRARGARRIEVVAPCYAARTSLLGQNWTGPIVRSA